MTQCFLFDIDGTLADLSHRLPHIQKEPKDWAAFFAACGGDAAIEHMTLLARLLKRERSVVFVTGRSDSTRAATEEWLANNGFRSHPLYMRHAGDHRPDFLVKSELVDALIADGYSPIMAFEDRTQVVEMLRARGIPCAQVAPGDF